MVTEETIQKSFKKAGILTSNMDVVTTSLEDDIDPFSECDLQARMECLIDKTMPADGRCTLKEYLEGDNELQVYASDDWESNFLNSLATMIKSKIAIVKIVTMKMWMLNSLLQK